ncbi:RloB family protein [Acinetobacter pittii]|uniref:RloB family protein n=1 Tax=Acinetobacter pittii TaxID=48296 RepID=UPI0035A32D8A
MSLRLGNIDPSLSRIKPEQKIKPKLFFVLEGAETERIYVQEFKNIYMDKILGEVICLNRIEKDRSNQFYIVTLIDKYFKSICTLNGSTIQKVKLLRSDILSEEEISDEFLQEKLNEIKELIEADVFENLFGGINLKESSNPLEVLNAIVELQGFVKDFDQILIIIDRDRQSFKSSQYDSVIEIAEDQGYKLGISNPCFEIFLFLHLNNINDLDRDSLAKNIRMTRKFKYTSYILREELRKYEKNYKSKSDYDAEFIVSQYPNLKENIRISNIATDPVLLKDNIGTSVYEIISPYL